MTHVDFMDLVQKLERGESVGRSSETAITMPQCTSRSPKTGRQCVETSGRLHGATHQAGSRAEMDYECWADAWEMPEQALPTSDDPRTTTLGGRLQELIRRNQADARAVDELFKRMGLRKS